MTKQEAEELKGLMDQSDHAINNQIVQNYPGHYVIDYQDSRTLRHYRMRSFELWQARYQAAEEGWLEGEGDNPN